MSGQLLVFVGVCADCGTPTEPIPAEGPTETETWRSAEQWTYLALYEHRATCTGRRPTETEEA